MYYVIISITNGSAVYQKFGGGIINEVTFISEKDFALLHGNPRYVDYKNRESLVDYFYYTFLNKTQSMFKWENLPKTIPQRDMELLIQTRGFAVFIEHDGDYFALLGNMGGRMNFDYMPSLATVANPYLGISEKYNIFYGYDKKFYDSQDNLTDGKQCVIINNDPLYRGLNPTLSVFANCMADTRVSRRVVTIMSRAMNAFIAGGNNEYQSIMKFIEKLEKGELSAVIDKDFLKDIKSLPFGASPSSARMITELIEAEQYDKAALYNELGLQANYNMKREAINSDEAQLGEDAILPFADIMLRERKTACERINELFGLNISVDFDSAWKYTREELENQLNESQDNLTEEGKDENGNVGTDDGDIDGDGEHAGK